MIPMLSSILPPELTALRLVGLVLGVVLVLYALIRRRSLANAVVLLLRACGVGSSSPFRS